MVKALKKFLKLYGLKLYFDILGIDGLLCAVKAKITKSKGLFMVTRKDCVHPFFLRVPSSDVLVYRQIFIDNDYLFLTEKQPDFIVDAGANTGLASIYFANKYPNSKIVAIEPEQSNFELLTTNVKPYPNIIPLQAALWCQSGELNLVDPGFGEWGFITDVQDSPERLLGRTCHTVKAVTIVDILTKFNIDKIDILKIDIEGAEREVFRDTSAWIERVNSIIIELHERLKVGCNRSFYCGSNGFDSEWKKGENVFLSRSNFISMV